MNTACPAAPNPVPSRDAAAAGGRAVRLVTALLVAGALAGCGSTAGIRRTDGNVVEAKIIGSDADGLHVEGVAGQTYRIDGRSVVDIDHPGNVAMVAGALLLGEVALLMTSSGFRRELVDGVQGDGMVMARPLTALFGIPGALLLGHGTYRYLSSSSAAAAFERSFQNAAERPLPSTPALPARGAAGAAAALSPGPLTLSWAGAAETPCAGTRLAAFCPRPRARPPQAPSANESGDDTRNLF